MKKLFLFLMLLAFAAGAYAQCATNVRVTNNTPCTVYYRISAVGSCGVPPGYTSILYALPPGVTHSRSIATTTFGTPPPPTAVFQRISVLGNASGSCGGTGVDAFGGPLSSNFINSCCPASPNTIVDWVPGGPTFAGIFIHN